MRTGRFRPARSRIPHAGASPAVARGRADPRVGEWPPRNAFRNASRFWNTVDQLSPTSKHAKGQGLAHRGLVIGALPPDIVVVTAQAAIAGAGPGAAWLPVAPDDHVAAFSVRSVAP